MQLILTLIFFASTWITSYGQKVEKFRIVDAQSSEKTWSNLRALNRDNKLIEEFELFIEDRVLNEVADSLPRQPPSGSEGNVMNKSMKGKGKTGKTGKGISKAKGKIGKGIGKGMSKRKGKQKSKTGSKGKGKMSMGSKCGKGKMKVKDRMKGTYSPRT